MKSSCKQFLAGMYVQSILFICRCWICEFTYSLQFVSPVPTLVSLLQSFTGMHRVETAISRWCWTRWHSAVLFQLWHYNILFTVQLMHFLRCCRWSHWLKSSLAQCLSAVHCPTHEKAVLYPPEQFIYWISFIHTQATMQLTVGSMPKYKHYVLSNLSSTRLGIDQLVTILWSEAQRNLTL